MPVSSEDFKTYGFSSKMGPQLRQVVEAQLREDLLQYGVTPTDLRFDWSANCLEWHDADWLDCTIENYSGIALLNRQGQAMAEGWLEFIRVDDLLLVYWDNLTSWDAAGEHPHKQQFGIPPHIWHRIPLPRRPAYPAYLMRNSLDV